MRKLCIYLDSSILGWALNSAHPDRCREANTLLSEIRHGRFIGLCSWVTEEEIAAAPSVVARRLRAKLKHAKIKLVNPAIRGEAERLAARYCDEGIVPRKHLADALHVAVATLAEVDALVSYNFAHIVSLETMVRVNEVNRALGLREIFICQPQEVIGHEGA